MADAVFQRLDRPPAYRVVSNAIERAILRREIEPGDSLPTEGDMATQFGVNRSTVREGMRNLEQAGFVQRRGKKLIVTHPSPDALGDRASTALRLQEVTFLELWQTTMELESLAAELAAERLSPELAERLRDNIRATAAALDNGDDLTALDVAFHDLIASAAGNKALLMARAPLARLFYPAFQASMFPPQAGRRLLDAHTLIADAIISGDGATARQWMRKHIVDFRRGYEIAGLDVDAPLPSAD
jgi:DNA-binding FadR family transcriptional regulator